MKSGALTSLDAKEEAKKRAFNVSARGKGEEQPLRSPMHKAKDNEGGEAGNAGKEKNDTKDRNQKDKKGASADDKRKKSKKAKKKANKKEQDAAKEKGLKDKYFNGDYDNFGGGGAGRYTTI